MALPDFGALISQNIAYILIAIVLSIVILWRAGFFSNGHPVIDFLFHRGTEREKDLENVIGATEMPVNWYKEKEHLNTQDWGIIVMCFTVLILGILLLSTGIIPTL